MDIILDNILDMWNKVVDFCWSRRIECRQVDNSDKI